MSLEVGGRADKIGNSYENRFLAKLLLRLVREEYKSVEVEPLGPQGEGVEFVAEKPTGECVFYQCKVSNGGKTKWTVADLQRLNILSTAQKHILGAPHNVYRFISPLPYEGIKDLCDRARTHHAPEDFVNYQLSNQKLEQTFAACESYLGLRRTENLELRKIINILAHCWFELVPDGMEAVEDLEAEVSRTFVGKAERARVLLENCVNDNQWYGMKLSSAQIQAYMETQGYATRVYGADARIQPRIKELNETYWGEFGFINNEIIPRKETQAVVQCIREGASVILHGRAGSGKSGCVEEISGILEEEQIPYLRIKLDRHIPKASADQFGKDLGLPESPVFCLEKIAVRGNGVLIFDQLDALRWTAAHSATALAVCKEMIRQIEAVNRSEDIKLSMLLVVRTFDYKNDNGIHGLITTEKQYMPWKEIMIDVLMSEEVERVVGASYGKMPTRLKRLLQTPSTLYIWTKLYPENQNQSVVNINQLMASWLDQILENCVSYGTTNEVVLKFLSETAERMNQLGVFSLPKHMLYGSNTEISMLKSCGLLCEDAQRVAFAHQTFLDYFLTMDAVQKIIEGEMIDKFIGGREDQTPNLRYRFLSILQELSGISDRLFLDQCECILESENVRYYYKCAVFEAVAQYATPSSSILRFAKAYVAKQEWHSYVLQTVYYGNLAFVRHLLMGAEKRQLSEEEQRLLESVSSLAPDYVVQMLRGTTDSQGVYKCLCVDPTDDSDGMFEVRMALLREQPDLLLTNWFRMYHVSKDRPDRALMIIKLLLERQSEEVAKRTLFFENDELQKFCKTNAVKIMTELFPDICAAPQNPEINRGVVWYSEEYRKWVFRNHEESALRKIVEIVRWSAVELGENQPDVFWEMVNHTAISKSLVVNEIILAGIENLPITYADTVIAWLSKDFPQNIFDYTGNERDYLAATKRILSKFSPHCSNAYFAVIEEQIYKWNDGTETMLKRYERRIEVNKEKQWEPVYYPFWGFMQKELLPHLDVNRQKRCTKELLAVLNRNTWINGRWYSSGFYSGEASFVVSPVEKYADKLPDKTWLQIIKTPASKMKEHSWKETAEAYVEATPDSFSSAFSRVTRQDPERFAILSRRFPENCYPGYISAVIRGLQENSVSGEPADIRLTCEVIERFQKFDDMNIKIEICRLVEKRAAENWPNEVLQILQRYAVEEPNREKPQIKRDVPEGMDLYTEALNTLNGCALNAIGQLLWEHEELADFFQDTVSLACHAADDSTRFAAMLCVAPFYNYNQPLSIGWFAELLGRDARVLVAPNSRNILLQAYSDDPKFYRNRLISACSSAYSDVAKHAGRDICALAIFRQDNILLRYIKEGGYSDNVANCICKQAASTYGKDVYHDLSECIILHIAENHIIDQNTLGREFFRNSIDARRDHDFLQRLFQSKSGSELVYSFYGYLSETDVEILYYADIMEETALRLGGVKEYEYRVTVDRIASSVMQLLDKGNDDPQIRAIGLDIWDALFQSDPQRIGVLADMLDK